MMRFDPNNNIGIIWLSSFFVLFVWWVRIYGIMDGPVFFDDARQHLFWRLTYQNDNVFPDYLFVKQMLSYYSGGIFDYLYKLLLKYISLDQAAMLVSSVLFFSTALLWGGVLKRYGLSNSAVFVGVLLLLLIRHDIESGVQRSFFLPLFLWTWLLYLNKSRMVYVSFLVQALIYPVCFVSSLSFVLCYELFCLWEKGVRKDIIKGLASYAIWGVIIGSVVLILLNKDSGGSYGSDIDISTMKMMPEFLTGGRNSFWGESFFETYIAGSGRSDLRLDLYVNMLVVLFFLLVLGRFSFKNIKPIVILLISSISLFIVAHVVLFELYLPSRYVSWTLPLVIVLMIVSCCDARLATYSFRSWQGQIVVLLLVAFPLVSFVFFPTTKPISLNYQEKELMNFLQSMPENVMIAGHPYDMDNIPLYANKKVLINMEFCHAWKKDYPLLKRRMGDMLAMVYAKNLSDVLKKASSWDVDFFVVNLNIYEPKLCSLEKPWNEYCRGRKDESVWFSEALSGSIVFSNSLYKVFSTKHLKQSTAFFEGSY